MNTRELFARFRREVAVRPLSMVTCYDAAFSVLLQEAGVDVALVGDSVANAVLGHARTADIGMAEMRHHVAAVRRGAPGLCVVADLPFGADATPELAAANGRLLMESGADAVKLEGARIPEIQALREAGIEVVGHLGLLPQTATSLRQVGRDPEERARLLSDALAVEAAGACALVLEHIPSDLGVEVTGTLSIPTVGIGAGNGCGGQVLVLHDMLGLSARVPPFVKRYAHLRDAVVEALSRYASEVADRSFPEA